MIEKRLAEITKADIEALMSNSVAEGRDLDYKLTLPGSTDEEKREFLADVSSFANASGGDLVFGVAEAAGVPTSIDGVAVADMDAEQLRLDSMIREGLDPRIAGVDVRVIEGFAKGPVVVMRIPQSFASPHMVKFKGLSRFYGRTSNGKFPLDVREIGDAFTRADSAARRVSEFHLDRLSRVIAGETPVILRNDPPCSVVMHVIPLARFRFTDRIEGEQQRSFINGLIPPGFGSGWDFRHNIDGFVVFEGQASASYAYSQFFRTGAIESVSQAFADSKSAVTTLNIVGLEDRVIDALARQMEMMGKLAIPLPAAVHVAVTGIKGSYVHFENRLRRQVQPFDRDVLRLNECIIEDWAAAPAIILRPAFDSLWNAAGYPKSATYNADGTRVR